MTDRSRLMTFGVLTISFGGFMAIWWFEWLRFTSPRLNYGFMVIVFLSPFVALRALLPLRGHRLRVVGLLFLVPVLALACLPVLGTTVVLFFDGPEILVRDVDPSFERVRQVEVAGRTYAVFRTNGGAMTSYGIVVRREQPLLVRGIVYGGRVCSCYPADDVTINMNESGEVECVFPRYGWKRPTDVVSEGGRCTVPPAG